MASKLGLAASYTFYGVCAVISFFLVQRFIHETKGKELEADGRLTPARALDPGARSRGDRALRR